MLGVTSSSTTVQLTVADGLARLVLDGPQHHNALNAETASALIAACDEIDASADVGVVVLTGANGTFCSGAVRGYLDDLGVLPADEMYAGLEAVYAAFDRVGRLRVPTLARMEGAAVGAGVNLALAADVRLATVDARIFSGFAAVGIHPGGGHLYLVDRLAGAQAAAAMGLFARPLSGARAREIGIVWEAFSDAATLDSAVEEACAPLRRDPELARALKSTFALTVAPSGPWAAATEIERSRQMWSLARAARRH